MIFQALEDCQRATTQALDECQTQVEESLSHSYSSFQSKYQKQRQEIETSAEDLQTGLADMDKDLSLSMNLSSIEAADSAIEGTPEDSHMNMTPALTGTRPIFTATPSAATQQQLHRDEVSSDYNTTKVLQLSS